MSKSSDEPFRRVEASTFVQRRQRWSVAEKVRLVEEAMQLGMSACYVARQAGIGHGQHQACPQGHAAERADPSKEYGFSARPLPDWLEGDCEVHPHSRLEYCSPREFLRLSA
jgi:hypothetical protein